MSKRSFMTAALALASAGAFAQISFTGNYSENFNSWPKEDDPGVVEGISMAWTDNTTKLGWYQGRSLGAGQTIFGNSELLIGQAPGLRGLNSLGMPFDTDRAVGSGLGDDVEDGLAVLYWGFRLQNNTGHTIDSVDIQFDVENWLQPRNDEEVPAEQNTTFGQFRVGGTNFRLQDFTNAPQFNLVSLPTVDGLPGPLNGNLPQNRSHLSATLSSLNWQAGQSLWVRWRDPDNLGRDAIFGIDNLNVLEGAPVPEPASLLMFAAGSALLAMRKRRSSRTG
jgi:hypothetical protein